MVSDSQKKATRKYEKKTYDKVLIRIRKDTEPTRATITQAATTCGMSLNEFIMQAIEEKMQRMTPSLKEAGKEAHIPAMLPAQKEETPTLRASVYTTE